MANGYFGGGDGSSTSPFIIEDAFDFNTIRQYAMGQFYFTLIDDINLDIPPFNEVGGWEPIPSFYGFINGNGHKVINFNCTPIPNGRQDVGFILNTDYRSHFRNIHFQDIYIESSEDVNTVFTFLGIVCNTSLTGTITHPLRSYSITGIVNCRYLSEVSTSRSGIIYRQLYNASITSLTEYNIINDISYIDIENIGPTRCVIIVGYQSRIRGYHYPCNINGMVIKLKGKCKIANYVGSGETKPNNIRIINTLNMDVTGLGSSVLADESEYIEDKIGSIIEGYSNTTIEGRLFWDFSSTSHLMPRDIKRHKFLLGINNEAYSYNKTDGLAKVGVYPITGGMVLDLGFDYLESVPSEVWQSIRDSYGTVEVFKHLKSVPSKTPVSTTILMNYSQELEDKILMEADINFNDHNNDIFKIGLK